MKLEGSYLRYYKTKTDKEETGSVNLETADWVRPYDLSPDCKIFEIREDERVFVFEAKDTDEMKFWMESIELIRHEAQHALDAAKAAKVIADTPVRIRMFDEEGERAFAEAIFLDMNDIYPENDEMTLRQHLDAAGEVAAYLADFVPETKKTTNRPARYDILAVAMELTNKLLAGRMMPVLQLDSPQLSNANLGDLHSLLMWLTRYQIQMRHTYCPIPPGATQQPSYCTLFEQVTTSKPSYIREFLLI